jgi:HEAT repeat protein
VRSGGEGSRAAALLALGEQGDDVLLDVGLPLLDEPDQPDRIQRAVLLGLRRLTSDRAVDWARASALDPASGYPARAVLAASAVEADLPQLRSLLAWSRKNDSVYDQCNIIDALDRLDDASAIDDMAKIYESTVYSYLRKRCALSLARLSSTFSSGLAVECLWDCKAETRRCGAAQAAASVETIRRLTSMSADPTEDEKVRSVADQRLA